MCSIFGALIRPSLGPFGVANAESNLRILMLNSAERGRDGYGYSLTTGPNGFQRRSLNELEHNSLKEVRIPACDLGLPSQILGNFRAEPTTEFVLEKTPKDQQPYVLQGWTIVHNGTIANDLELRTNALSTTIDSAAIVEQLAQSDNCDCDVSNMDRFKSVIASLRGRFAILALHDSDPNCIFYAANYRPIFVTENETGLYFASSSKYFRNARSETAIPPYSVGCFRYSARGDFFEDHNEPLLSEETETRVLVVCSGGLDSTVVAKHCKDNFDHTELIHFQYGCRAETKEVNAVTEIAERLGVPLKLFPLDIYDKKDSNLFNKDSPIAGGESGAEYAHEWVPARNLVLLSVATAYAEANGFNYIALGNNLEEAGAYPDNEPEFINKLNALLPFAVGDGKQLQIVMPVGNMMKHEIVAYGNEIDAPMDITWSCYKQGEKHCGKCGPCFMRKTAFEINKLEETVSYLED